MCAGVVCTIQALHELRAAGARNLAARAALRLSAVHRAPPAAPQPGSSWARVQGSEGGISTRWGGAARLLHTSRFTAAAAAAAGAEEGNCGAGDGGRSPLLPDWRVGVALAGASFEAYGGLSEEGLPEKHANGTEVHYVDR